MTLKEIARRVGTSPSTVSRVLNGYKKQFSVKPELREKIMKEVERSGYKPNPIFQSMRSEKKKQVSFMFYKGSTFTAGSVISEALDVIAGCLSEKGILYNYTFDKDARANGYSLPHWKMSGLIIPDVLDISHLKAIEEANYPYVVFNGLAGEKGTAVMSDEKANMEMVMEYLINQGHRRIAYLDVRYKTPTSETLHYSVDERRNAYCDFVARHNLPEICSYNYHDTNEPVSLQEIMDKKATAVVTFDDFLAVKVLHEAWSNGIKVPDDLSVITFNNSNRLNFTIPALTCMEVSATEMGQQAAESIISKITYPESSNNETLRIKGKLVVRDSVKIF